MEHISYPKLPVQPPIQIPFLCREDDAYDGLDFEGFPERRGWMTDRRSSAWLNCADEEAARRAQSWLYFGTLSAVIGKTVDTNFFLESNHQAPKPCLSSRGLILLLWRYQNRFSAESRGRIISIIKEATLQHSLLERRITSTDETCDLSLVSCAISVLLQTLGSAVLRKDAGSWKIPPSKAIQHRMIASGWCPYLVELLSREYSCTTLYYLSGNSPATGGFSHDRCTTSSCLMHSMEEASYEPMHKDRECVCSLVGPSSREVASIIEAGEIPLVSCWLSPGQQLCFEIVKAEPATKYVAISHVWSGGLGNPHANSIATCQLRRLFEICGRTLHDSQPFQSLTDSLCRESQRKVHFWLDTICIPVGNESQAARKISIARMSRIYSEATKVLVLDYDLQKMTSKHMDPEEILSRIACSSWMYRCWTLQEASLSRPETCCFQFADKTVSCQEISDASKRLPYLEIHNPRSSNRWSVKELAQLLQDLKDVGFTRKSRQTMWSFKNEAMLQADSFAATWNNFLGRASTKRGDIYRIFAAMQDFKAAPFREVPDELRMKAILKGHAFLPLDLFFSGASGTSATSDQRGNDAGSSWVPYLPSGRRVDCQVGYLRMHTDYSVVQSSRIESLLISLGRRVPQNFSVLIKSGAHTKQLFIEHGPSNTDHRDEIPHQQQENSLSLHCILFPKDTDSLYNAAVWYNRGGALFEVVSHDNKTMHLRYRSGIRVCAYSLVSSAQASQVSLEGKSVSQDCQTFIDCGQSLLLKLPEVTPSPISNAYTYWRNTYNHLDLSSWPTVPHFFHSPEGPLYEQVSGHLYAFTYLLIQLSWTLSFVTIMALASRLHIQRIPVFLIYLGKVLLTIVELIWYRRFFLMIERLSWSHDFGISRDVAVPSYYEKLKSYPSLLWGFWRAVVQVLLAVVFMVVGFKATGARWAQWGGAMALIELALRTSAHILWTKGPETRLGQKFRILVKDYGLPPLLAAWSQVRQKDVNAEQERVPYSETSPTAPVGEWRDYPGLRFWIWLGSHFGIQQSTVVNLDLTRGPLFPRRETWRPAGIERGEAYVNGNLGELHWLRLCVEVAFGSLLVILAVITITLGVIVVTTWGCCRLLVQYAMGRCRSLFERS